ncbi:hypothetical protein IP92_01818 [Pseudoduganella flava]|uniref:Glycosyltransferase RgtA/B/C/D-like domain-containing protein n=1 Tax=Pseudoduganella flava TaxID=871742 RepID=A0A562PVI3_9BURK|nr:hypothetical protein [Pseudoduganella flava]QGZ39536.1 hypothetical protein GO485_11080 [Pseudoduganella flava]TWI48429.1 hypothetical protein IP92_01818 [Pseudoduganella flava]
MRHHDPHHPTWLRTLLPVLFAVNVALLLFFLAFDYQLIFHSDSAIKNLLAQEIVETHRFFPPDWTYVNKDLWVLYGQALVLPLLAFMPNGYSAHAVATALSAALVLTSGWLLTRMLGASRTATWVALLVLSSGLSLSMAEHIYGQSAYEVMFWLGVLLLYGYWAHLQPGARHGAGVLVAAMAVVVCWSNPQRALVFYLLPLLAAAWALRNAGRASGAAHPPLRHGRTVRLFLLASVAGMALYGYTMHGAHNASAVNHVVWRDLQGMGSNLLSMFRGVLLVLDGLPQPDSRVTTAEGLYAMVRLLAAAAALYLVPRALLRMLGDAAPGRLFCATFVGTALALNLLPLLTTSLTDPNNPDSIRYLTPSLLSMLVIFAVATVDTADTWAVRRRAGVLTLAVLATSAPTSYLFPYVQTYGMPTTRLASTAETRVMAFLRQQGLRYGYATFWHAGKITVLSDHAVRIRPVEIVNGMPTPSHWLSSRRWYTPGYYQGPTFLLLRKGDPAVDTAALAARLGTRVRVLAFEDWQIAVFDVNLANLPAWPAALGPVRIP